MRRVSEGAKVPGLGRCPDLGGPDKGGLSVFLLMYSIIYLFLFIYLFIFV